MSNFLHQFLLTKGQIVKRASEDGPANAIKDLLQDYTTAYEEDPSTFTLPLPLEKIDDATLRVANSAAAQLLKIFAACEIRVATNNICVFQDFTLKDCLVFEKALWRYITNDYALDLIRRNILLRRTARTLVTEENLNLILPTFSSLADTEVEPFIFFLEHDINDCISKGVYVPYRQQLDALIEFGKVFSGQKQISGEKCLANFAVFLNAEKDGFKNFIDFVIKWFLALYNSSPNAETRLTAMHCIYAIHALETKMLNWKQDHTLLPVAKQKAKQIVFTAADYFIDTEQDDKKIANRSCRNLYFHHKFTSISAITYCHKCAQKVNVNDEVSLGGCLLGDRHFPCDGCFPRRWHHIDCIGRAEGCRVVTYRQDQKLMSNEEYILRQSFACIIPNFQRTHVNLMNSMDDFPNRGQNCSATMNLISSFAETLFPINVTESNQNIWKDGGTKPPKVGSLKGQCEDRAGRPNKDPNEIQATKEKRRGQAATKRVQQSIQMAKHLNGFDINYTNFLRISYDENGNTIDIKTNASNGKIFACMNKKNKCRNYIKFNNEVFNEHRQRAELRPELMESSEYPFLARITGYDNLDPRFRTENLTMGATTFPFIGCGLHTCCRDEVKILLTDEPESRVCPINKLMTLNQYRVFEKISNNWQDTTIREQWEFARKNGLCDDESVLSNQEFNMAFKNMLLADAIEICLFARFLNDHAFVITNDMPLTATFSPCMYYSIIEYIQHKPNNEDVQTRIDTRFFSETKSEFIIDPDQENHLKKREEKRKRKRTEQQKRCGVFGDDIEEDALQKNIQRLTAPTKIHGNTGEFRTFVKAIDGKKFTTTPQITIPIKSRKRMLSQMLKCSICSMRRHTGCSILEACSPIKLQFENTSLWFCPDCRPISRTFNNCTKCNEAFTFNVSYEIADEEIRYVKRSCIYCSKYFCQNCASEEVCECGRDFQEVALYKKYKEMKERDVILSPCIICARKKAPTGEIPTFSLMFPEDLCDEELATTCLSYFHPDENEKKVDGIYYDNPDKIVYVCNKYGCLSEFLNSGGIFV